MTDERAIEYRAAIDELVRSCSEGQGQIGARRAIAGVWNSNATPSWPDRQYEYNKLLAELDEGQRDVLASMLTGQFESGVHEALVILHEHQIAPFEIGYEGAPFHDFAGRLEGFPWPESLDRSTES